MHFLSSGRRLTQLAMVGLFIKAAACAGGNPNSGVTSTSLVSSTTPPIQGVAAEPNAPSSATVPTNTLPIVPAPLEPNNVPLNSVWIAPGGVSLFGDTGALAADAVYNRLGSVVLTNDLAMLAQANPTFIANHIVLAGQTDAGRLVYNVTLFDAVTAQATVIPVSDLLLADSSRNVLDGLALSVDGKTRVLWPALYTKALALKLGGYTSNFNDCVALLAGMPFADPVSMYDASSATLEPILAGINTGVPIRTESLTVSNGQVLTQLGPADSNVTVTTQGPAFVCETTQGLRTTIDLCLQANNLNYVIAYTHSVVTVRNVYSSTAGASFDGLYGYHADGSVTLPVGTFIDLTQSVTALTGALPSTL